MFNQSRKCFGYQPVHQSSLESLMGGSICSTHFLLFPTQEQASNETRTQEGTKGSEEGGKDREENKEEIKKFSGW